MKRRVKLTRNLTKVRAFCNFIPAGGYSPREKAKRGSHGELELDEDFQAVQSPGHRSSRLSSRTTLSGHAARLSVAAARGSILSKSSRKSLCSSQSGSLLDAPHRRTSTKKLTGGLARGSSLLETLKGVAESPRRRSPSSRCSSRPASSAFGDVEDVALPQLKKIHLRQQGKVKGRAWVRKRREAIQAAPMYRERHLHRLGQTAEALPPRQGYRAAQAGSGTPFATISGNGQKLYRPSSMRLEKATSIYGQPVWHEVFGPPVTLPPLVN